jgi:pilus assembly protein Flp/PilA
VNPVSPRNERGASAVEYGLLVAGIAAMIAVAIMTFGGGARGLFNGSCSEIVQSAMQGTCPTR